MKSERVFNGGIKMKKCIFAHISLKEPVEGFIKKAKSILKITRATLSPQKTDTRIRM